MTKRVRSGENNNNTNNSDTIENKLKSKISITTAIAFMFLSYSLMYFSLEMPSNTPAGAVSGNASHIVNNSNSPGMNISSGTANTVKNSNNVNKNASGNSTSSSAGQLNSNVSRLPTTTTTQGNVTTNANAPGSPFPPKQSNSSSYFPETNKVAIVPGAALLRDKAYQPNPVNIKTGGVVTWNNEDTVVHTVTSGTGLKDPKLGNEFDSGLLGGHFSHIFFKPGAFPYFCQIHPTMVGKVIVK
jgi:plastocyanin